MSRSKEKIKAITITVILHLAVLLAAFFLALRTPLPLPGEEGVEVDLGYTDEGMGLIQPEELAPASESEPVPSSPPPQSEEQIITQDRDETPAIEEVKQENPAEEHVQKPEEIKQQQEEIKEEPAKEPEPVVNPNALYKGKSTSDTQGGDEGQTGNPGDQGVPTGGKDVKKYDGLGGSGNGISYSLAGRGAKQIPKPAYNSDEQGRVVVTIWVNRNGDVIRAEAGAKGTTISDISLRNLARDAALRAKFTSDPQASQEQKGTITYVFIKMN